MADKPTPGFLDFVEAVKRATIEFPALKPYLVAQAILECGRGTTELFKQHSNPLGIHYHPFLAPYAKGVDYQASDGPGLYAQFFSFSAAVHGYFSWFDNWEHYGDWRVAARQGGLAFLKHIGPHYCPPGFTEAWKAKHGGLDYADYIHQNLLFEASELLRVADGTTVPPPTEDFKVLHSISTKGNKILEALADYAPMDFTYFVVSPAHTDPKPAEPTSEPKPVEKYWQRKGVCIDIGHGKLVDGTFDVGAVDADSKTTERSLNEIAVNACVKRLRELGCPVDVEPAGLSLHDRGARAAGYDVFISQHHNWYYEKAQHCVAFLGTQSNANDVSLAKMMTKAIAAALDDKVTPAIEVPDAGSREEGYTVPNAARATDVRACLLIESYFIDHKSADGNHQEWSAKAGVAQAEAIVAWLKANKNA